MKYGNISVNITFFVSVWLGLCELCDCVHKKIIVKSLFYNKKQNIHRKYIQPSHLRRNASLILVLMSHFCDSMLQNEPTRFITY